MNFEEKVMKYLAEIHQKMTGMDERLSNVERTVIHIENDHGQKLEALFDGYEQNTQAIKQLKDGQDNLSLKVDQNTLAIKELQGDVKSLEKRVTTQEIKLERIK